jgi:hypothetical protein
MRTSRLLALLAVLFGASAAKAAEPATAPGADATAKQAAPAPVAASPSLPLIGLMTDIGIPDGVQGSLVLRPWKAVRFSVGGGYNMISKGVRAGVSILPFGRGPSLTVEAGRFFDGDGNAAVRKVMGSFEDVAILQRVGYDYANAHLGLDFGYQRVTFYIHGGMSYLTGKIRDTNQLFQNDPAINGMNSSGLEVTVKQDPTFKAIGPSAKIGLIVYLW